MPDGEGGRGYFLIPSYFTSIFSSLHIFIPFQWLEEGRGRVADFSPHRGFLSEWPPIERHSGAKEGKWEEEEGRKEGRMGTKRKRQ
jgi:hypothetical protein